MPRSAAMTDQKCSGVVVALTATVLHQKTRSGAGTLGASSGACGAIHARYSAILALTVQRYIVRGLTFGAVKG